MPFSVQEPPAVVALPSEALAPATAAQPPKDATPLSGLVVEGRGKPPTVARLIEDGWGDYHADRLDAQFARWDHPPCVAVLENGRAFHDALMRAFRRIADTAGAKIPRPEECPADALVILVSGEPRAFLDQLKARKALLRNRDDRFDEEAYEKMLASKAPVSVWRLSEARVVSPPMLTRARPMTYSVVTRSFTFVWLDRLDGVALDSAAAYAAFAILTLGVPEHPSPHRSVLNLLARPDCAPAEGDLSTWDVSLLKAMYETDPQAWLYSQLHSIALRLPPGEPCPG